MREPGRRARPGPRGRLPRRPPVQRAGRRRPDRRPPAHRARAARGAAGDGPVSLLAPKVAAAKAVGALARRAGRGGGTSLPGKLLTRLEPHAIGPAGRAARARQPGDLGHQRQDDHRRDGRRRSSSAPAAGSSTTAPARTWPAASPRRWPTPRGAAGASSTATSACSRSTSSGSAPVVESSNPRAMLLANLFRDQLDRYGELDTIADRWAAVASPARRQHPARAQRRRPARRRPRPRPRRAVVLRRRGRRRRAPPSSSTPRTPSTAAAAGTPTSTTPPTSATSAATTARTAATAAPSPRWPPSPCSCAASAPPPSRCARRRARRRVELPLPGLYNVYNALGAAALCLSLGVELPTIAAGLGAVAPAFGRAETIDLDGRPTSILLVKNPAGANEVLRTLALEGGELDLLRRPQRPHRRRPRRLLGVGRRLGDARPARPAHDLLGHARRRARAADEVRRRADRPPARRRGPRRRARPRAAAGSEAALRPPHLHRAARAARACSRARRGDEEYWR